VIQNPLDSGFSLLDSHFGLSWTTRKSTRGGFGVLVAYFWLGDQATRFHASFEINTEMNATQVGLIRVATKLPPFKSSF
jgi:hypothetical protein